MNLVVGYDEHPASQIALKFAAGLAAQFDAELNIVHVLTLDDYPIDPDGRDWEERANREVITEREAAERILQAHDVTRWTYDVVSGDPVRRLVDACEKHEALMIIVGKPEHGFGAMLNHLATGSISRGLLHTGHRPVVIVPENGVTREGRAGKGSRRHHD